MVELLTPCVVVRVWACGSEPQVKAKPLFISTVLKEPCVRLVRRLHGPSTHMQTCTHIHNVVRVI